MKKKIVLWGNDENDKKVLIGIELKDKENKVNIYTFDQSIATEAFYNTMMDDWRVGKDVAFPEGHATLERPLSMTEDLLPETLKVQRTDLITRAKTEWHFAVLSAKLYDMYHSELGEIKEKVDQLMDFDNGIWDELVGFWGKVSDQIKERNLFREQADRLRDQSNELFTQLKELRKKANDEFSRVSQEKLVEYKTKLNDINEKVEKGLGLKPLFEELKKIQTQFKDEPFTRGDRSKVWKNIDVLFKKIKEKKFGKIDDSGNNMSRLDRRYNGLMSAIDKMQRSIDRDKKDIEFQNRRVGQTDGQLEAQIRQAKVKMIEGRIESKQEKLNEMLQTKAQLEKKKDQESKRMAVREEKKEIQKKKKEVKDKIAAEIAEKNKELDDDKLKKAAAKLSDDVTEEVKEEAKAANEDKSKESAPNEVEEKKEESLLGAIATVAGEAIEDMVDTVKAVGSVVGDKIGDKVEDIKDAVVEIKDDLSDKIEDAQEAAQSKEDDGSLLKKGGIIGAAAAAGGLLVKEIKEKVEDVKEVLDGDADSVPIEASSQDLKPDETISEVENRMGNSEEE